MVHIKRPQVEQHSLEAVTAEVEVLLGKLRMELEVAPTDRKAHQDLLRRTIQAAECGCQVKEATEIGLGQNKGLAVIS